MGSSCLSGKPMAKIMDKPMIGHLYENVKKNQLFSGVAAATCDDQIYNYIKFIGGRAVMILDKYERASDGCEHSHKKELM